MKVDGTVYWTVNTYTDAGVLVDADATPTVDIRKNGSAVLDVATSSKRAGTTGIYDYSYNPASEAEGDTFTIEETATISSQSYRNTWSIEVLAAIAALNNFDPASDSVAHVTLVDTTTDLTNGGGGGSGPTVQEIVDGVWDESVSSHNVAGTFGKAVKQLKEGIISTDGTVTFGSTVTEIATDLTSLEPDFYADMTIAFTSGANAGQSRVITAYSQVTNTITVDEPLSSTPSFTDEFIILTAHVHSVSQLVDGVWLKDLDDYNLNDTSSQSIKAMYSYIVDKIGLTMLEQYGGIGGDYRFVAGALTEAPSGGGGGGDATAANQATIIADIAALNDFNPALDTVAHVTLVDTTTDLTNGGAGGGDATLANQTQLLADIAALNDLSSTDVENAVWNASTLSHTGIFSFGASVQDNLTAVNGLNDFNPALDTVAHVTLVDTTTDLTNGGAGGGDATLANQNTILANQAVILADTDELQSNQGDWATATGFATASSQTVQGIQLTGIQSDLTIVKTDVSDIDDVTSQFVFTVAGQVDSNAITGGGGDDAATIYSYFTSGSNEDVFKATTTVSSNMRGTDGANTVTPNTIAPVDVSADVSAILLDTAELQANQNNWLTATTTVSSNMRGTDNAILASSTPSNWSIMAINGSGEITTSNPAAGGGSAHTAQDVANLILAVPTTPLGNTATGSLSLVDTTTDLTNGGSGGDDAATIYSYFTAGSNEDAFKADVSGLSTSAEVQANGILILGLNNFDPASDTVAHVTLVDTTTDLTNGGSGGGDATLANQITILANQSTILADTNELQSNQGQWLTATTTVSSNMRGTDGANTVTPNTIAPDNAGISANSVAIAALNDFDPALDTVAHVTLVDTTTDLTNGGSGGGDCPTVQEIVDGWGNQPQGVYTTPDTLGFYLDAQVSTAGSGGTGLYQATVRIQDSSNNSLQGARVNIDGTTLTLTTGTSGEVTFNLDSGVYLLEVSPPAGYDTPVGQVLTVSSGDPSDTTFTLTGTSPPTECSPPWIG
jgi:hypothetical protein